MLSVRGWACSSVNVKLRAALFRSRLIVCIPADCSLVCKRGTVITHRRIQAASILGFPTGQVDIVSLWIWYPVEDAASPVRHHNSEEIPEKRKQGVGLVLCSFLLSVSQETVITGIPHYRGWRDLINTVSHLLLSCSRWRSCRNGWQSWVVVVD